jgi:hypothetical protein
MKKKYLFIPIVLIVTFITFIVFPVLAGNRSLVTVNSDEIISITITEWQGQSATIDEKNEIDAFINYIESLEVLDNSWHFGKPDKWSYRVAMYSSLNNTSKMMEGFYISSDEKAYKNNFTYEFQDFDYTYLSDLLTKYHNK